MRRSFCSARRSSLFRSVCIFCGWARLICSFTRASRTTSSTPPAERPQEMPSAGSPSSEAFFSFRAFSPLTGRSRAAARSTGGRIRSSAAMPPSARPRWRSASPTVIISQSRACGRCHSRRRYRLGTAYRAGEPAQSPQSSRRGAAAVRRSLRPAGCPAVRQGGLFHLYASA